MKYTKTSPPLVCMMTQSNCYKGTSTMNVVGVLWHSTGAPNPWLSRYVQPDDNAYNKQSLLNILGVNKYRNDFNHIDRDAGLNCWVGKLADGTVTTVQTMPWNYKPWGCGSGNNGSCNNGWIQFEICEDDLDDKSYFDKCFEEACQITAYLCWLYKINPVGKVQKGSISVPTILCHADSHYLGLGSNHGDVYNWFPKFGKSMEDVRTRVLQIMKESKVDISTVPSVIYNSSAPAWDSYTYVSTGSLPSGYTSMNISLDGSEFSPYVVSLSRNTSDPNWKTFKDKGVCGAVIELGQYYSASGSKSSSPINNRLDKQTDECDTYNVPFGLYFVSYAQTAAQLQEEVRAYEPYIRTHSPQLGIWIEFHWTKYVSLNTSILNELKSEMIRLGFKAKMGLKCSKDDISKISWKDAHTDWYLWVVDPITASTELDGLLQPEFFNIVD